MPLRDAPAASSASGEKVLEAVGVDRLRFNGYAFLIECKYHAHRHRFRMHEVPIVFVERAGTSKNSVRTAFRRSGRSGRCASLA
jgi:dolichol-phosphate mannosyltransferase